MLKTVLVASLLLASVLGVDFNINSMADFETFAADPSIYGAVYLNTDLDFTGKTVTPIGSFQGMLYGNGHFIKNLKIISNVPNVGLFGSLTGVTVKDLIIDYTCTFKSTYANQIIFEPVSVGSVVGKCTRCTFENIINQATITYASTGTHADSAFVGGIAGIFSAEPSGSAAMKNVANYGAVSNKLIVSDSGKYAAAGGIAGYSEAPSTTQNVKFTNCLNYGEIITENNILEATGNGGILGAALGYPSFKNVVSAGSCVLEINTASGSVLGLGVSVGTATFENCYVPAEIVTKKLIGSVAGSFTPEESYATGFTYTKEVFDQLNSEENYANVWVNNANEKVITFQVNGNTPYFSVFNIIIAPVLSSSSSYTFSGWYSDELCETAYTVSEAATEDITLHGGWQYTLTYRLNSGELNDPTQSSKDVIYMHKIGQLPEATKEGHTFSKWTYEDSAEGAEISADIIFDKLEDTNIYAQWTVNQYTITFNFNNGTDEPLVKEYDYGATVTYPEDPTLFEYTFQKWVSDYSTTTLNGKPMPAQNVTVNATWKLNEYQVVFHIYEGNDISYTLSYGAPVTYPADPIREGYTFMGWDNDTVTTTPSGGVTINAIWSVNTYFVTFDFDNGTEPIVVELEYGSPIEYPMNVIREGLVFVGWNPSPSTMPAYNLTITTEYAIIIFSLTFTGVDGKILAMRSYAFNETIVYPEDPKRSGYTFVGWSPRPATMPSCKFEIKAKWAKSLSTQVEVVLEKGLEKEEAVEMLKGYTQDEFTVEGVDVDAETGEVRVVVTFADKEKAKAFVVNVNGDIYESQSSKNPLKDVGFVSKYSGSFSLALAPLLFGLILV